MQENFDTTTLIGRAMGGIISTFTQLESDIMTERTSMSRSEQAKNGLYMSGGNVFFDYRYKSIELTEEEVLITIYD